jgi:hypothetical protein
VSRDKDGSGHVEVEQPRFFVGSEASAKPITRLPWLSTGG